MNTLLCATGIYILFAIYLNFTLKDSQDKKKEEKAVFACLALFSFAVRIVVAGMSSGYETDMNCFRGWASAGSENLPWNFYDSVWCDYPPGYIYILSIVGFLRKLFPVAGDIFIKMPAMICDVLCGYTVYKMAVKSGDESWATPAGVLMVFNVATIVNSALWGQVDSVFTLLLLLSLNFLQQEKYTKSAIWLGVAITVKIQTLMFVPVYIFFLISVYVGGEKKKAVKTLAKSVLASITAIVVISLPFVLKKGLGFLLNLYVGTASQYPYASLNAFNFFSLLEANQKLNTDLFMMLSYKIWGTINICIAVFLSGILFVKGKGKGKLFYTAAVLISLIYAFSSDMHERYLFPAIVLFFAAAVLDKDKKTVLIALGISLSQVVNVGYLYYLNLKGTVHIPANDMVLIFGSLCTVVLIIFSAWYGFRLYLPNKSVEYKILEQKNKKINRRDVLVIALITAVYSIISFVNLGNITVPCTKPAIESGDGWKYVTVAEFDKKEDIGKIVFYRGLGYGQVALYVPDENGEWKQSAISENGEVYRWQQMSVDVSAEKIMIAVSCDEQFELFEVGIIEKNTNRIINTDVKNSELFDEQELVSVWDTYKNGTYFDEIYHARTAYEHIEGIYPYEVSHPPLGKLIISLGIRAFGMNPFGWRFMGNIFGILMIPLMYIWAKRIFGKSSMALWATAFLVFDFMHFTQTRIATIDSFAVFFIMLMYYLMYIYYDGDSLSYKKSLLILLACGIAFGVGISTKWICVYSGLGLAVLFAVATVRKSKNGFPWFKTCLWCVLFFVIVPFVIYFLSYLPYYMADKTKSAFEIFWENQKFMLSYHGKLTATHPFQSKWYTWPAVLKPMWYFGAQGGVKEGMVSSIVAFGNPLIWWCGTISTIVLMLRCRKNKTHFFVVIGYLSQFMPWIVINRAVFIYHYFASVPFIILALTCGIDYLKRRYKNGIYMSIAFMTAVIFIFVMFYPVLSGMEISKNYVDGVLTWFSTWTLSY